MKKLILCLYLLLSFLSAYSQSSPVSLRNDISIKRLMTIRNRAMRMDRDPITGNIFYLDVKGKIYEIINPKSGVPFDTLRFTPADDSVDYAQCIYFRKDTLYVSGNITPYKPTTTGIIRQGVLQAGGKRIWSTVMITQPYKSADYFDHLFSGMILTPNGDSITICSGARGDHGEIQTLYGRYPFTRNEPLTGLIFRVPAHTYTYLINDSVWIKNSGYAYAYGIRNTYDMAYDTHGNLFGVENSDSRDNNEEMNWLRRGLHYGFPYIMGDRINPAQYPWYNPKTDKLINHYSSVWRLGFLKNDKTFPPMPAINFEPPIQNTGPDADKYRDTTFAKVHDASNEGKTMGTFTSHRSPLGLVFDKKKVLKNGFNGDAFMLSWTKGYDSSGCTSVPDTNCGPFADSSEDMMHLQLKYDSLKKTFTVGVIKIIYGFSHPVDAIIDSNKIYVIEYGVNNKPGLYEVTMPSVYSAIAAQKNFMYTDVLPNPATDKITINFFTDRQEETLLAITDINGKIIYSAAKSTYKNQMNSFDISGSILPTGIYFYTIHNSTDFGNGKIVISR